MGFSKMSVKLCLTYLGEGGVAGLEKKCEPQLLH